MAGFVGKKPKWHAELKVISKPWVPCVPGSLCAWFPCVPGFPVCLVSLCGLVDNDDDDDDDDNDDITYDFGIIV